MRSHEARPNRVPPKLELVLTVPPVKTLEGTVPLCSPMIYATVRELCCPLYSCAGRCHALWSSVHCNLELCADVIVSAAARLSISVGGGAPPVQKIGGGGAAWRERSKTFFSKIHEKISFYPQNFLRNFLVIKALRFADDQC